METFPALLALCAGNSPVTGEFPAQRPVTRSFDVFFDLRLNKRLSKQSRDWWFETPSRSLWRHCNAMPCLQMGFRYLTTWRGTRIDSSPSNGCRRNCPIHWNGGIIILMKFPSLASLEVIILTTSSVAMMKISSKWHFCFSAAAAALKSSVFMNRWLFSPRKRCLSRSPDIWAGNRASDECLGSF